MLYEVITRESLQRPNADGFVHFSPAAYLFARSRAYQAAHPRKRIVFHDNLGILSELGIETGLLMMPLLPFIHEDEENVIKIVEKAKYYGAKFIYASFGMTLRDRQRLYYYDRLDELFPGMKEAYMKRNNFV